ncbi:cyclin-D5-1-like [Rhodamnia argentea]|uniref:Cyclin-D5-1-like n=1 Tax=Rhodamnia argentea TaxID=178133 RepID=A0A8B8PXF4_9MYRT|nr:cyclin-D5-1-like [Rhodamnia argentea]
MDCSDDSDVVSLLCQEDEAFLVSYDDHPHGCTESTQFFFALGDEDEYIRELIRQEARDHPPFSLNCSSSTTPRSLWLKRARTSAIDWIFDRRESFGFHLHTAYLSIAYFDRFLAIRSIADGKLWAVRLLSLACLLLAAKMEEYRVPAISDFQAQDFLFEGEIIQNTELLILKTLEWKLASITPFSYLHYLVLKFHGQSREREFFFNAMELVLALSKEINLVDYRPSVIAAAAVLSSSSDAELSRKAMELKTSRISSWDSQDNEHIFVCYNLIQGILKQERLKTPREKISHRDVLRSASPSFTYASGIKRRLPFIDGDQSCPVKKKTRRQ